MATRSMVIGAAPDCQATTRCGDGNVDVGAGETCDDLNTVGGDGCSASCQSNEMCGNLFLDAGEFCDDGSASATCDVDCSAVMCGDGVTNNAAGEQCEDLN